METVESCTLCEKFSLVFETVQPIGSLLDLPNTFDPNTSKYVWKHRDFVAYALIPRSISGTTAQVDFYICIDEDDLDDLDLASYSETLLREEVLPSWDNAAVIQFTQPISSPPTDLGCWKHRHPDMEEVS